IRDPDPTSVYYVIPKDWRNPYVEFWNFAVAQRVLFQLSVLAGEARPPLHNRPEDDHDFYLGQGELSGRRRRPTAFLRQREAELFQGRLLPHLEISCRATSM